MAPSGLFSIELPVLEFSFQTLELINFSSTAERLFRRSLEGGRTFDALQLLYNEETGGIEGTSEGRKVEARERLVQLANQSEQLPWGQTITLEYHSESGEGAIAEKAEVLVSLRRAVDSSSFTILFVRPIDTFKPRPLSHTIHHQSSSALSTASCAEPLGSPNSEGGGGRGSIRSSSFSSIDRRTRPRTAKEREKLPLSPEVAAKLSQATARVSTDNPIPSSPQPQAACLRAQSPDNSRTQSIHSAATLSPPAVELSAPPTSFVPPDGSLPIQPQAFEAMQSLWVNSPLYHSGPTPPLAANMDLEEKQNAKEDHETPPPPESDSCARIPRGLKDLTDLVETQPQVTFLADPQGQVEWLNDAWYRYTGFDNRFHPSFERWMACFHPDDLPNALEIYLGAMQTGEPFKFDYRIRHRDGNMRWNVCHGRPKKDAEGNVLGWVASIFDQEDVVQARHDALLTQKRIKAVLEASQTLLISVNANLEIDFQEGSLSLPDILPTRVQSTSIHCHLQDLFHSNELTEAAQKIIDEEETEVGIETEFVGVDGQKSYVRFRLVPIRGDPSIPATSPDFQTVTGVIIVGVNVTEAIKIEKELQKSRLEQVELESREKAKTDFLTTMSHELRTPLTQIELLLELVLADKKKPLDASHRSLLEQAIRSGDALLELIGAVLDVRKVEAGELKLEHQPFLLSEVIEDARLFSVTSQAKGLTFEEEIGDFYQGTILGDRLRLRQVLTNALSNAVKFTSKGGIVLRVQQTSETDSQLWLQVDVEDSGVGIEKSVLPVLFQPFRQAHAGTAREFGGTGLGLAISKKLVELMNGQIELISEYGHGSTFRISVPLTKAPLVDVKDCVGSKHVVPATSASEAVEIFKTDEEVKEARKRRKPEEVRVLLAEDNKLIREIVSRTLRGMKFHVDAVEDGLCCLDQLEKEDYDVVLMDGQMPRLDGYEATRSIRQNPKKRSTRIIALTASAISGDKERCLASGMDAYLAKPIRANDLQLAIFEQVEVLDAAAFKA
ncbi:uncharacterized protein JCM6883_006673 [Sporobolomyces salmoneus]|uniref:uncharacterized protein n=1 Tax=Sporobolomyces salmoneus TaxID=183962 RepID=UPI003181CF3E